ncbi:hypothetical protein POM88_052971 [Heracleum sosnowskyi]|uniref:DM2 domain-containing protein n=1 Tax=Heracleum sosnowskyi TaxID=360622 RepID=A0AAD8LYI1_9APIA|nr:hypothetical protein POM88_052971 [Heracleum sosnowskyi]
MLKQFPICSKRLLATKTSSCWGSSSRISIITTTTRRGASHHPKMEADQYTFGPYKIDNKEVFYSSPLSYAMVNLRPLLPVSIMDNIIFIQSKKQKKKVKRKRGGGGFTKVCSLSPELQKLTGVSELPRTEVVKQMWNYIREKNLQDPLHKRNIICDDALRDLFNVDSVKYVSLSYRG